MRHVALWKAGLAGRIRLDSTVFASVDYDQDSTMNAPLGYDDIPEKYAWDSRFKLKTLKSIAKYANDRESSHLHESIRDHNTSISVDEKSMSDVRRVHFSDSLEDALGAEGDLIIPLFVPPKFISFANNLLQTAFKEHGLLSDNAPLPLTAFSRPRHGGGSSGGSDESDEDEDQYEEDEDGDPSLDLALWRVNNLTAWQQVDRRIDEVYECLWSFHFGNATFQTEPNERFKLFVTHLSRRAIREKPEDEYESFARWIGRQVPSANENSDKWMWNI